MPVNTSIRRTPTAGVTSSYGIVLAPSLPRIIRSDSGDHGPGARWGGHSAYDLATVLRCNVAAFGAMGGCPRESLYDRMKTAVVGEGDRGIVYNRSLIDLARHYGLHPKACRAYRAQAR